MTRAQNEFSVLICDRKTQNRVMTAYDIHLQMLVQGTQLTPGMAESSLTGCLADALRTTFSVQSKDFPTTVNTQAYTDMINRIKLAGAQPSSNIVETLNNILSKHIREFAHAEQVAKQRTAMGTITKSTTPPNIS